MPRFRLMLLPFLIAALVMFNPAPAFQAADEEEIIVLRDAFGVPNIFARTEEGAVFGMGYAQAEDRLEEICKQYRLCTGTMAEVFGPEFLHHDYRQRLWQHQAVAEANYPKLPAKIRAICQAYQAGIKQFMKEHPEKVPAWAPKLEPWQVIALGRFIIWRWPEGDAGGDLLRGGIKPDPVEPAGSNQWVVAASRTADKAPLALIDPHLSWYGSFRFYEARLYGGDLAVSGMAIPGLPLPNLGHGRFCSVAMTTGGPDAADVYMETINPNNPNQYRYDGNWRDVTIRKEIVKVKEGDRIVEKKFDIAYSHHGPIVARKDGKAYAMKVPYFDQFRLAEQGYAMATAKNLNDMKKALSLFQLMEQNIMVATVQGDIFYVRNGRVPIRPKGPYDWRRPVPGHTSASEWQGIHALGDLVQSHNPWQGYMQNCNVSPEHMMFASPMTPERYQDRPYLYNADNPLHQRAAMTRVQLHANTRLTIAEAMEIALSTQVYNAELWQKRLLAAWEKLGSKLPQASPADQMFDLILRWNRRCDAGSVGAIAYRYWFDELDGKVMAGDKAKLGKAMTAARAGLPPPDDITDQTLVDALTKGGTKLLKDWGRLEVKYGEVYRVGRKGGKQTWPVDGGTVPGMATPRAIGFQLQPDGKTYVGQGGQTSTQLVQLTNPPRSWTFLPLGESDDPASKHFDDQAEKLFGPRKLKPTYFLQREELERVAESRKVLKRAR
jgi:acyl-homoserine-lactone acylase